MRVVAKGGRSGWLEAGTFETAPEQEARERRTKAVADFATIEGRIVAPCPVYLAPDYGAARWGELEEGDPVEVVLAEHDFLGVRLLGIPLAFVPAHAVRYLAPPASDAGGPGTGPRRSAGLRRFREAARPPRLRPAGVPRRRRRPPRPSRTRRSRSARSRRS